MPSLSSALSRRTALVVLLVGLSGAAGCGIPTEPRWDRAAADADGIGETAALDYEVARPTTYLIEAAPVTAAVTVQASVVPATEIVIVAPSSGRIGSLLTSTGSAVRAGDPIIEWVQGSPEASENDVLRIEILERQIQLAALEGRGDDAATATTELAELRDRSTGDVVRIEAPVDGVLGQFIAVRSTTYDAGEPLFTVGDPETLRVDLELDQVGDLDQFADIDVGAELRVIDAQNRFAEPTAAVVVSAELLDLAVDAPVGTAAKRLVSAELAAGTSLVVGDRVLVDVDQSSAASSRRVNADAVLDDGRGPFLIVADDAGWRRVDIALGVASEEMVEVVADIDVGTMVVVP